MSGRKKGTKNGQPNPKDVEKLIIYLSNGRRKDKRTNS